MTHIFVTRRIPDIGISMLKKRKNVRVEIYEQDRAIPRRELLRRVKGKQILLTILTDKIDKEVFDAAGDELKMIANYAVGFDNIDVAEANRREIIVTNAPCEQISESVAEHTIALLFALAKRIPEADRFVRAGKYKAWGPELLLGTDLFGKTIGIIGTGRIGSGVMRRLRDGFNMNILYHDVKRNPELETQSSAQFRSLTALLKQSDFVSIHVPLLPTTHHLISTKELKLMKKTAFLINTARGPIVDEKALTKALVRREIAGAGLDVYECEPLIDCDPSDQLELRSLDNVVLTPHTASATHETRDEISRVVAKNILAFLDGKEPPNIIK